MSGDISSAISEINRRLSELRRESESLERKLTLLKGAEEIVGEVLKNDKSQVTRSATGSSPKELYSSLGMTQAVRLSLANYYGAFQRTPPTLGELKSHLEENGFVSASDHFSPALSATLARLAEQGEVKIERNQSGARTFRFRPPEPAK